MKKKSVRPNPAGKRLYTFRVLCSFQIQHTFTKSEVEPDPGGGDGDFCPTAEALKTLEKELRELIGHDHAVTAFEACAESDALLGVTDGEDDAEQPTVKP